MSKEPKRLCKWKKEDIKEDWSDLRKIVKDPEYICKKCGRAANDDDYLCKPEEI